MVAGDTLGLCCISNTVVTMKSAAVHSRIEPEIKERAETGRALAQPKQFGCFTRRLPDETDFPFGLRFRMRKQWKLSEIRVLDEIWSDSKT